MAEIMGEADDESILETAKRIVVNKFGKRGVKRLAKHGCDTLASKLETAVHFFQKGNVPRAQQAALKVAEGAWAAKEESGWPDKSGLREAYVVSQVINAVAEFNAASHQSAMERIDMAIILGGPGPELNLIGKHIEARLSQQSIDDAADLPDNINGLAGRGEKQPQISFPIHVKETIDENDILSKPGQPFITGQIQSSWQAANKWRNIRQLASNFGHRKVPVEKGRVFGDEAWKEDLITLQEFFHMLVSTDDNPSQDLVYLAQHNLFEQLPGLAEDMEVPEVIHTGGRVLKDANVWWGTGTTVTPLHYDSYDNFLAQVVGMKYIRLYSPDQSHLLYEKAAAGKDSNKADNSSSQRNLNRNLSAIVDLEKLDTAIFPLAANAVYVEAILRPGDTLFIPKNWWHYVRNVTTSMSVNFWF